MDYIDAAQRLMRLKAALEHFPLNRHLNELTRGEFFVLDYLRAHREVVYPRELSREMCVSTARIAALLKHMEEKGLIVRTPDPRDSRQVQVSMTAPGALRFEEKYKDAIMHVAEILETLGAKDSEEYLRIEEQIVRILSKEAL